VLVASGYAEELLSDLTTHTLYLRFREFVLSFDSNSRRAEIGLMFAVCVGAAGVGSSQPARSTDCPGPADLEASVRARANSETYLALGTWFEKQREPECAEQTFLAGLKLEPGSDRLAAMLVSLYVHESQFESASALSERIARAKPHDLEAQRIYLRTLVITGNNDLAIPLGRKLLAQAPQDEDLLNLNGLLESKAGDDANARIHLEAAVKANPFDFNARVNLGVLLAREKDAPGAKEHLEKAVELGADEPQVHFELAKALRSLGQTAEADRQLDIYKAKLKAESDESAAVLKATQAAEAEKAGDKEKAARLYREASSLEPSDAELAYRLAQVLAELGDTAAERAALEQAIGANPGLVQAQYDLGYLDFKAGDYSQAEQHFRRTVEAVPENARAWISLAATLGAESRIEEAKAAVANALRIEPNNAGALELSNKLDAARDPH
jgi:Flp pilus assembly protein TadD